MTNVLQGNVIEEVGSFLKGEYASSIAVCKGWYNVMDVSPEKYFSDHVCDIDTLHKALQNGFPPNRVCRSIASAGNFCLLLWVTKYDKKSKHPCPWDCPLDKESCANAAKGGYIECLRWLHMIDCPWDQTTCANAAKGGHLECLQFAHENGCLWDENTSHAAAEGGHMDCLEWVLNRGCLDYTACYGAARGGHMEILDCLISNGCTVTNTYDGAAEGGHLHILKWAHENDIPVDGMPAFSAASKGKYDCLQWVLENMKDVEVKSGFSAMMGKKLCLAAVYGGDLNCLKLAYENGFSLFGHELCSVAAEDGRLDMIKWLRGKGCRWDERTCAAAAKGGHSELLMWLKDNDCPWDAKTCAGAAEGGNLKIIIWARENGCPWDDKACAGAAEGGYLKILIWLREKDCPWDNKTHSNAAKGGYLNILKWIHKKECPVSYTAIHSAVEGGHVECVEWELCNTFTSLKKVGYMGTECCNTAAEAGYLKILKMLRGGGFPWDEKTCYYAADEGNVECVLWAIKNGCPIDVDNIADCSDNGLEMMEEIMVCIDLRK